MNFDESEEISLLRDTIRRFIKQELSIGSIKAILPEICIY
jgi:hypothetical protein